MNREPCLLVLKHYQSSISHSISNLYKIIQSISIISRYISRHMLAIFRLAMMQEVP